MAKRKTTAEATPTPEATLATPLLTDTQIAQAATNDPSLSPDEFKLGDRTYKYTHLSYDNYVSFMVKIKPLMTAVVGTITAKARASISLPGIELSESPLSGLIEFCSADIPDMVVIIVNNYHEASGSPERITVAQIKKTAGATPMSFANVIMGQVMFNNMISDFASFFVQMMPALKAMGILSSPAA